VNLNANWRRSAERRTRPIVRTATRCGPRVYIVAGLAEVPEPLHIPTRVVRVEQTPAGDAMLVLEVAECAHLQDVIDELRAKYKETFVRGKRNRARDKGEDGVWMYFCKKSLGVDEALAIAAVSRLRRSSGSASAPARLKSDAMTEPHSGQ
jgi:hypothetical protein